MSMTKGRIWSVAFVFQKKNVTHGHHSPNVTVYSPILYLASFEMI